MSNTVQRRFLSGILSDFQSPPLSIFNGQIGYRFANGWRIQFDGLNLLNARTDQATYACCCRLLRRCGRPPMEMHFTGAALPR
ncbi:MAG TPA: hypothetical protein VHX43_18925 [Xanthobacteraceae bacterium]|nr:hypothetical protein [Xanthobacteraceae bacterium]